jgi:hypothetical protein
MRHSHPIERQEKAMRNMGIRGAIGMGLTWGAAWFGAGILVARVPGFYSDLPFALLFAPFGVSTGILFFGIAVAIEGRHGLARMSLSRFAAWGAACGVLQAVAIASLRGKNLGGEVLVFGPVLALAGALCAAGSLAVARRSERATLPSPTGGAN